MKDHMRQIRATFSDLTIRVYQAYCLEIADRAVQAQTFVAPFKMKRMTWIKPSFLWMMYRSRWGTNPGQERVLAIDILRSGFEWALANACLTHFDHTIYSTEQEWLHAKANCPVRVQFDPDRSPSMEPLESRAIQVGLSGIATQYYVDNWIKKIVDVTTFVKDVHTLVSEKQVERYMALIPKEAIYPVPDSIGRRLGIGTP
jgi:hypothetical protein